MTLAPVEYLIIRFPGNRFRGEIAPEIARLVETGTVNILDLVFIKKDADGSVMALEYEDLDEGAPFAGIDGDADGIISDEDIAAAAEALEPDSSALFILWEDLWAADLGRAVANAGGELVIGERIARQDIEQALATIKPEDS